MTTLLTVFLTTSVSYAQNEKITYLTDIEGNWEKFSAFVENNEVLYRDKDGKTQLKDDGMFVFGGDAVDHFSGDLRITQALVDLKKRYPERVILIAGNRDINKIRLTEELSPSGLNQATPRLKLWLDKKTGKALGDTEYQEEIRKLGLNQPVARLKWALTETMGAPKAFENRRTELSQLSGNKPISDQEILNSYLKELGPEGSHRQFLSLSQLAFRHGETLFVHGATQEEAIGSPQKDASAWIDGLNAWYNAQVASWKKNGSAPSDLIAYQQEIPGSKANQASVVYGRFSDSTGNPALPSDKTIEWAKVNGIKRIVVGHTPNGDSPSVLRRDNFEIVIADNSSSPHLTKLYFKGDATWFDATATLNSGLSKPLRARWTIGQDGPLGKQLCKTGQLIKGQFADGKCLAYKVLPGFKIDQQEINCADNSYDSLMKCISMFSQEQPCAK